LRLFPFVIALALAAPAAAGVHVSGNHLVDDAGRTIRLLGVNRSGLEYACVQGWGFADGPTDATSIAAMKTWSIDGYMRGRMQPASRTSAGPGTRGTATAGRR